MYAPLTYYSEYTMLETTQGYTTQYTILLSNQKVVYTAVEPALTCLAPGPEIPIMKPADQQAPESPTIYFKRNMNDGMAVGHP